MTISSAAFAPVEISESDLRGLRTARDVQRFIADRRRRSDRSLRQIAPQPTQDSGARQGLSQRVVEFPETTAPADRPAEISDHQIEAGRRLAGSICFATHDAQVRG